MEINILRFFNPMPCKCIYLFWVTKGYKKSPDLPSFIYLFVYNSIQLLQTELQR